MGCGCGGNTKTAYLYTSPKGVTKEYDTEIAAKVAQIRDGGGGSIRPITK